MSPLQNREAIVEKLRRHRAQLEARGVRHLDLFGSIARGDGDESSDIDLAAEFDRTNIRTLFDAGSVAALIADALGTEAFDLADRSTLRPAVRRSFQRNHVPIF